MALGEIAFAGSWLLILAVLVLDLVGILHRGAGFRVISSKDHRAVRS